MSLIYKTGNLFDGGDPAIAHGVNCRGKMGSGIAVQFRERYPEMYREYRSMCNSGMLDLGQFYQWRSDADDKLADAMGWEDAMANGVSPLIYNLVTQVEPGPNAKLSGILVSVGQMLDELRGLGVDRVGIPRIGCGIGALEWPHVEGILLALTEKNPYVNVVVYTP